MNSILIFNQRFIVWRNGRKGNTQTYIHVYVYIYVYIHVCIARKWTDNDMDWCKEDLNTPLCKQPEKSKEHTLLIP